MAATLLVSDLHNKQDQIAALQLVELAKRLQHCGSQVTLATSSLNNRFDHLWSECSQNGVQWIQPTKRWRIFEQLVRTPLWLQTRFDVVHFFISDLETKSLSAFIWLSQLLHQWRNSVTAISLSHPFTSRHHPLLRVLMSEAQLVFCVDEESLRFISSLRGIPQNQALFKSPLFDCSQTVERMVKASFNDFGFLTEPYLYAPGFWQDCGDLQKLCDWFLEFQDSVDKPLILGWNWREKKDDALKRLFATQPSSSKRLIYLPAEVSALQHQWLLHHCSGLLLHQLNPRSLVFADSLRQARLRNLPVFASSSLGETAAPLRSLTEDPVNFFSRAYQQALQQNF